MKLLILTLLASALPSLSHSTEVNLNFTSPKDLGCRVIQKDSFSALEKIEQHLEHFGASQKEVEHSPCKNQAIPSLSEMENFINSKLSGAPISKNVHGHTITNESPTLVKMFQEFTTAMDFFDIYPEPKRQKNVAKAFKIPPSCKKVMCALETIWDRETAIKMLYVRLKYSYNTSELKEDMTTRFLPEELNDIILSLEDMPKHLVAKKEAQKLVLFNRDPKYVMNNEGTMANASIMAFAPWSKAPSLERQYAMFHELAHNIGWELNNIHDSSTWLKLSGWTKKGEKWSSKKDACFISGYAKTNPHEDFAESVTSYRYGGKLFKKMCPEKYDFIKTKVFKGLEYDSISSCLAISPEKQAKLNEVLSDEIQDILKENFNAEKLASTLQKSCPIILNSEEETLKTCYKEIVSKSLLEISDEEFNKALRNSGIPATKNKLMFSEDFSTMFMSDPKYETQVSEHISIMKQQTEQSLTKLIKESFPQEFKLDWRFMERCRLEILDLDITRIRACAASGIIASDRLRIFSPLDSNLFKKMPLPENLSKEELLAIAKKRDDDAISFMITTNVLDKKIAKTIQEMRYDFSSHLSYYAFVPITKNEKWTKLEPKEFCMQLASIKAEGHKPYMGTNKWPEDRTEIPHFTDWCIKKQSESRKRRQFTVEELNEWFDQTFKIN